MALNTNALQAKIAEKAQPIIQVNDTLKLQLAKRGVDEFGWNTLKQSIFPGAQDGSVLMAIDYCKARRLDVLKKPVHIVPIWNSQQGKMIDTIWPSISELRTTAMRTGQYAGKDETVFGPQVSVVYQPQGKRKNIVEVDFPKWAQVTVYRMVGNQRVPFVGPKVYWEEAYATSSRDDEAPNSMWQGRPFGQLDKCAEAAALRAAFPEEIGNDYSVDEARQFGGMKDVSPVQPEPHSVSTGHAIAAAMGIAKNNVEAVDKASEDASTYGTGMTYTDIETGEITHIPPSEWPDTNSPEGKKLSEELDLLATNRQE